MLYLGSLNGQDAFVDSLENVLQAASQEEQVLVYNQLARHTQHTDFKKNIAYNQMGEGIARIVKNDSMTGIFIINQGRAYANSGQLDSADIQFRRAVRHFKKTEDLRGLANVKLKLLMYFTTRDSRTVPCGIPGSSQDI